MPPIAATLAPAEVTIIGSLSGILHAAEPVSTWPDSAKERWRDQVYRVLALVVARLLLPLAALRTPEAPRQTASEWALSLRFPSETLDGLTPNTRAALVAARTIAFWRDGELISVTSGHRDPVAQQRMFDAAVRRYGSVSQARRWVLPPVESSHVRGTAMDIRPFGGARWLDSNGGAFDLYRTFDNEWWHFEFIDGTSRLPRFLAS